MGDRGTQHRKRIGSAMTGRGPHERNRKTSVPAEVTKRNRSGPPPPALHVSTPRLGYRGEHHLRGPGVIGYFLKFSREFRSLLPVKSQKKETADVRENIAGPRDSNDSDIWPSAVPTIVVQTSYPFFNARPETCEKIRLPAISPDINPVRARRPVYKRSLR